MKIFLLILSFILYPFAFSEAATYWVHPSGNNGACTNTTTPQGSGGNAKTTIAAGTACLSAGDTLNVRTGTYSEKVDDAFITIVSGGSGSRITVLAYDGQGTATIRPPNSIGGGSAIGTRTHDYITFDGFTLDCSLLTDSQAACLYNTGNFNIFQNMEIKNMGGANGPCDAGTPSGGCGEGVGAFGNDSQYLRLNIHDIHLNEHDAGGNGGHGYYLHGQRNTVDNTTVRNVSGMGIQVYNSGSTTESNNTVKNSFFSNTKIGATNGMAGIYLGNGTANIAYNNVIYDTNYVGIQIGGGCTNCAAYNNTVVNVTNQAFEIASNSSGTLLKNNLLSGNGNTFLDNGGASITHDHNGCAASGTWCDVVGALNFANAGANDYHLLTGSTAIDQGANLGITYSPDKDGVARPTSGPWEIGAYEFVGSGSAPIRWVSVSGGVGAGCSGANVSSSDPGGSNYQTYAQGAACLNPGDTLMLKGGTYTNSHVNIPSGSASSFGNATIIKNAPGETVTFTGSMPVEVYNTVHHIIIDGSDGNNTSCSIGSCTTRIVYDGSAGASETSTNTSSYIRFKGIEFKNHVDNGLSLASPGGGVGGHEVLNSRVHDNGDTSGPPPQDHGIYLKSPNSIIEGNDIYANCGAGVHGYSADATVYGSNANTIVRNNRVRGNGTCAGTMHAIIMSQGANMRVYNNLVYGNDGNGIVAYNINADGLQVYNNSVYNNTEYGLYLYGGIATGTIWSNNISENNGLANIYLEGGSATTSNNLCSAALATLCIATTETGTTTFNSPGTGDFTIKAGSAAINGGTNLGTSYSPDIANVARPSSGPWEIGAYELAPSGPPPTDDFARAGPGLGSNWLSGYTGFNSLAISGGQVQGTVVNANNGQVWSTAATYNHSGTATIAAFSDPSGGDVAVILRASAPPTTTFYYVTASLLTPFSTYIYRCVAGTCNGAAQDNSVTWAAGDTIKASITGSVISVSRNGTPVFSYTDGLPLTGLYVGVGSYPGSSASSMAADNFIIESLGGTAPAIAERVLKIQSGQTLKLGQQ